MVNKDRKRGKKAHKRTLTALGWVECRCGTISVEQKIKRGGKIEVTLKKCVPLMKMA